jgi:hypothetical protein
MSDSDISSHYNDEPPTLKSEEEEIEMPTTWAKRQQLGILQSWNTRRDEEMRAWRYNASLERGNAKRVALGEENSRRRYKIE